MSRKSGKRLQLPTCEFLVCKEYDGSQIWEKCDSLASVIWQWQDKDSIYLCPVHDLIIAAEEEKELEEDGYGSLQPVDFGHI
jgi:hypothetical protein